MLKDANNANSMHNSYTGRATSRRPRRSFITASHDVLYAWVWRTQCWHL